MGNPVDICRTKMTRGLRRDLSTSGPGPRSTGKGGGDERPDRSRSVIAPGGEAGFDPQKNAVEAGAKTRIDADAELSDII